MLITEQLASHVKERPNHIITQFNGREITYSAFYEKAKRLAGFFQAKGYQQEDVIALYLNNSDYFLICYYACQLGGFTVMPVNTKLAAPEIEYIFKHSEAKTLVYDVRLEPVLYEIPETFEGFLHTIQVGGDNTLEAIFADSSLVMNEVAINEQQTSVIFYTSGTTGKPKGVMLSAQNVYATAQIWGEAMDLNERDRMQIVAPLFHCAASHVFSIPVIYAGGTIVIEEAFSPEQALTTMEQEKITIFFGVPAMYSILLNTSKIKQIELPSLRLLTYGAAPMPYELVRKVKSLFPNVKVQNLYGQTENSPAATTLKDHFALDKVGSVGEPLPKTEVQVVDEFGDQLPHGQVGEIVVKGPQVMKGYLKNEEETNRAIQNGWLYSGDLGRFDEDGLLYIVDRKKDMIIRGGENVYPVEVEEVLYQIPELLEAAVVGVPHTVYGEVPKAFVVLKDGNEITEEEILAFCSKRLAKFKMPVEVDFMESLPRNASGKVLKNSLRNS
ncbi:long-chain fatty acid--CoA ligase [Psychrobacillus sp. BL-248-WT-3]|uniref:class I adenylate-forming enzyme family protein n=1 Tax=Psychrobacillus sp. BL-248-WT-3 TaxID=2725306 RepID=UPI00146EAC8D|nr:long-chain fatty acid--CoA ligase [Psychrobacillus sp. BL-248-WT-3]NME04976.1 long-chain fatty acid--CoA ligase [Psychrobacillus sp. BL-248-WT-3]